MIDVHENFGRGKAHVQCRHQALAAGQYSCVVAVIGEKGEEAVEMGQVIESVPAMKRGVLPYVVWKHPSLPTPPRCTRSSPPYPARP